MICINVDKNGHYSIFYSGQKNLQLFQISRSVERSEIVKLQLGKMRTESLAEWFGIKYGTFRKNPANYFKKLEDYCEYEKVYGGILIKEIYIEEYDKHLNFKDQTLYLDEIKECVENQDGLATLSGMARKYTEQGVFDSERTARRRLTKAGVELFGKTNELTSIGPAGMREYLWAIKLDDYNHYRLMTEGEEKRFDEIIVSCYTAELDKVKKAKLLEDQLKKKEIDVDEYFEIQDRLGLDTFKDCIFKFKEETGEMIVRCTKHQIIESLEFMQNM